MRFKVEVHGKLYTVGIDVCTNCWVEVDDGNQIAYNSVTLNHKDSFDLAMGAKLALGRVLKDLVSTGPQEYRVERHDRIFFWDAFKRAFHLDKWTHKASIVPPPGACVPERFGGPDILDIKSGGHVYFDDTVDARKAVVYPMGEER